MSKVYTVNEGITLADQIPSIAYISELVKLIEDAIFNNASFEGLPYIEYSTEKLPVGTKENEVVDARTVKTDTEHRFINETILRTLVDKPTKMDLDQSIKEVKQQVDKKINDSFTKIVNTPNAVNKLRDVAIILNEEKSLSALLNLLSEKVNINDYQEHIKSTDHVNNNDRKALNILLQCVLEGFSDWNAAEGAPNAIRNKPESLPANGGNADSVSNHSIKDLINKDDYDIVIGSSLEKYSKDSCDIYAENGIVDSLILLEMITALKNGGIILFKRGNYDIKVINSCHGSIIFKGTDRRLTTIKSHEGIGIKDSVLKDISVVDSYVCVKSNCEIERVNFKNCTFTFSNMENSNITNCTFENCTFISIGGMMNNIIKFNRFIQTKPIQYIGGNNIISENIY